MLKAVKYSVCCDQLSKFCLRYLSFRMWHPNPKLSFRRSPHSTNSFPWYMKRKIEPEPGEYDVPQPKMLITEEKMVNQLRGIHLSQEYTSHETPGTSNSEVDMDDALSMFNEKSSALPTLVMSDEIRELQRVMDSPLPQHLLDNFKRPTNALVLWRPPAGDLGKYLSSIRDSEIQEAEKTPQASSSHDVEMNDDDNNNESANQNMNRLFTRTV